MNKREAQASTTKSRCGKLFNAAPGMLAISVALAFGVSPLAAYAQSSAVAKISIPAQSLNQSLLQLGQQANIQIYYLPETVQGLKAPAISGSLTPKAALDRLLAGSDIIVTATGNGVYSLKSSANGVSTLPTVTVVGITENPSSLHLSDQVGSGALGSRSQLNTPFSTTVVDSQDIEQRQASTLGDIFNLDASVVNQGNTYNTRSSYITVRGLQLDYANGYKLNGVPIINYGVELPYEDFEQVQLLKGLSGFMYGFGSPGGIVNYVTKKPPRVGDGLLLSADVGYRSNSIFKQHVDIGDRFGSDGMFGFRLNAGHESGTTYNGGDLNSNDVALSLDAHLTSKLTWTLDSLYQKRRASGQVASISTLLGYTGTRLPSPLKGTADNLASSDNSPEETEFGLVTTGLTYAISPDWKISTNYSHTKTNRRYTEDWLYIC